MEIGIREIGAEEGRTVGELLNELQLSASAFLLEINGELFYPEEITERKLSRGDRVRVIPLIAGG